MSRWLGFDNSGGASLCVDTVLGGDFYRRLLGRCQDGLVSISRETFGCVSTHVEVETFIAGYSGDVKMVWFRCLERCLVVCRHKFRWRLLWLFTREMSRWFGSTYSGAA